MEVIYHENVAKDNACMTTKGILNVYTGQTFYIIIANFGKANMNLLKEREVGEV